MTARIQKNTETNRFELINNNTNELIKSYVYESDLNNYINNNNIDIIDEVSYTPISNTVPTFGINTRFDFVTQLTQMIINRDVNSFILTGSGGIGKSYNLLQTLGKNNKVEDEDYIIVKGGTTARGMFDLFYNNPTKLIIFDDCDDVLKDKRAINLLKGLLDTTGESRIAKWITVDGIEEVNFTGQVIFISNLLKDTLPQPLVSRSYFVDLHMTSEELISRLNFILPNMEHQLELSERKECLDLLNKYKEFTSDLNARTLIKLFNIRASGNEHWEQLAIYSLMS